MGRERMGIFLLSPNSKNLVLKRLHMPATELIHKIFAPGLDPPSRIGSLDTEEAPPICKALSCASGKPDRQSSCPLGI